MEKSKMRNMRKVMVVSIYFAMTIGQVCAQSEIGRSELAIINAHGDEKYTLAESNEGLWTLCYKTARSTFNSGEFESCMYYFFDSAYNCERICVTEPYTEANDWVKTFNLRYVPSGKLRWYDYADRVTVTVMVDNEGMKERRVVVTYTELASGE